MIRRGLCGLLLLSVAGCGGKHAALAVPAAMADWRTIALPEDRARLRGWRDGWLAALAKVRTAGKGAAVTAQEAVLLPDAAQGDPAPPPGDYRCRVTKLGAQRAGLPDYTAYPWYRCRIVQDGRVLRFAKLDGSQRPTGALYPDDGRRLVFLGTMLLGGERDARVYGCDAERDMIGAFERIGPARWRLALPAPRWESLFDVIELVPA